MLCPKCNAKNEKEAKECHKCGAQLTKKKDDSIKIKVKVPESITLNTGVINKLSNFQKMYVGGGLLIILSSFLPWVRIKTLNLSSALDILGGELPLKHTSLNIWNFGFLGGLLILFYFLPLAFLTYIAYQELLQKTKVSNYLKSIAVSLLCLLTFSLNLYLVFLIYQIQSFLTTASKLSGTGDVTGSLFGIGLGLIGSFIGCALVVAGFLGEIKVSEKLPAHK